MAAEPATGRGVWPQWLSARRMGRRSFRRRASAMLVAVGLIASVQAASAVAIPAVVGGSGVLGTVQPSGTVHVLGELDALMLSPTRSPMIEDLTVLGRGERLMPRATTDVWGFGDFAYLGTFSRPCGDGTGANGSGVRIFDLSAPPDLAEAGVIPSVAGSRVNDVKVARVGNRDILVHSNEPCSGGPGGFEVWDVTDPLSPVHLASVQTDDINAAMRRSPRFVDVGVHNLFLFSQGERHFAAAVVEAAFGNFQIFELTDPTAPELVGFWGAEQLRFPGVDWANVQDVELLSAAEEFVNGGLGSSTSRGLHDITIGGEGTKAYLSNWDAGLVLLDIANPGHPRLVSVAIDPEGGSLDGEVNSHAAWPSEDGTIVVETEEDFAAIVSSRPPSGLTFGDHPTNTIPGAAVSTIAGDAFEAHPTGNLAIVRETSVAVDGGPLAGSEFSSVEGAGSQPRIADTGPITGEAVWIGRACNGDTILNAASFDPGDVAVARRGECLFADKLANAARLGAAAIIIGNNVTDDSPWGGVRIWDFSDPENPVLASTFHTICSADPVHESCDPRGTYTAHNVIIEDDLAFLSWYTDGVIVLDISDPFRPVQVARFRGEGSEFEAANGGIQVVWGVHRHEGDVLASDVNGGLYVLDMSRSGGPTGRGAGTVGGSRSLPI